MKIESEIVLIPDRVKKGLQLLIELDLVQYIDLDSLNMRHGIHNPQNCGCICAQIDYKKQGNTVGEYISGLDVLDVDIEDAAGYGFIIEDESLIEQLQNKYYDELDTEWVTQITEYRKGL